MKRAKFYKCEICGEEVFKEYRSGQITVMQIMSRAGGVSWGPHSCSLNLNKTNGGVK